MESPLLSPLLLAAERTTVLSGKKKQSACLMFFMSIAFPWYLPGRQTDRQWEAVTGTGGNDMSCKRQLVQC